LYSLGSDYSLISKKLRPKKSLGQHFLYDPAIAGKIAGAARLGPGKMVVELGAGRGILTKQLISTGARLIALELDKDLTAELAAILQEPAQELEQHGGYRIHTAADGEEGWVEVINADFTKISLTGLLIARGFEQCVLFGNIPYHLTRHVLFSFLVDEIEMIESAYLMMQREVGERIVSAPGSRVYGITSVVLQSLYDIRIAFRVAPGSFFPKPKVESVVLEFVPKAAPLVRTDDLRRFTRFVKNVFQQRRKTISNSLKTFYALSEEMLRELHAATAVSLTKRPEALSKEELWKLFITINEVAKV
jgi:16S rRNA (adenine1518-N6/adenine1519-N6)-dimethyltransferase